jgi:hypothetical protein
VYEAADPSVKDIFRYKIPASFMSSCAWCSNHVANALAIAGQLGKPSFCRNDKPAVARDSKKSSGEARTCLIPLPRPTAPSTDASTISRRSSGNASAALCKILEWSIQKRGPHAWIVVKFNTEPPLSALDLFISAEIPDPG